MHRLEEPVRRNLPPHSRFSRARQNLSADRGKLHSKSYVDAETTDRIFIDPSRMLTVNELGKCRQVPDRSYLARDRMLPTFSNVRNGLGINADGDLKGFGLRPVDDQRVRSLVCCSVQLAGFDARDVNTR